MSHHVPHSAVSNDQRAKKIVEGFTLNSMNLRDADTGKQVWEAKWDPKDVFANEQVAKIPKEILKCKTVSREISFSSKEVITNFHLTQKVLLLDRCIEEWKFDFGFVIPNSTNNWQTTIVADPDIDKVPIELVSGRLVIETNFYDGELHVATNLVRVFYV